MIERRQKNLWVIISYYIHDLIDCDVWSDDNRFIGKITDVFKLPAQDVWEVSNDKRIFLIPAAKEFVKIIDIINRKIVVSLIEGLIEGDVSD